jgi:excisionase family DNA binding protein
MRMLSLAEVAGVLGVSVGTVRRLVGSQEMASHRIGGVVRVSEGDLDAFLAARRVASRGERVRGAVASGGGVR